MDDSARAQVEHAGDSGRDFIVFQNAGTKSFHIHAQRFCLADCVGNLDFAAGGQPGSHHILGYPARGIRAGAVTLVGSLPLKQPPPCLPMPP